MSAAKILAASTTVECKKQEEKVDNFDFTKWKDHCKAIMKSGLLAKLSQNVHCFKAQEATNDTVLVEASPYDKLWGAGLSVKDTDLANMQMWQGKKSHGRDFTGDQKRACRLIDFLLYKTIYFCITKIPVYLTQCFKPTVIVYLKINLNTYNNILKKSI